MTLPAFVFAITGGFPLFVGIFRGLHTLKRTINIDDMAIKLYLFAIAIITLLPLGRGSISGLEVSIPFILLSISLLLINKKQADKKKTVVLFLFFAWSLWIILGISFSYITYSRMADHESSFLRHLRLIEMYLPSLIVFSLLNELTEKQQKAVYRFYIFLFFLVTAEAAIGWILQLDILVAKQRYSYPGMGYIFRAGGVANDSSAYGSLALILGVASIIGLRHTSNSKILYFMVIVGLIFNIYISLTRTLVFAVALYFILDVMRTRSVSLFKIISFSVVVVSVVAYGIGSDYMLALMDRISGTGQIDITSGRLATWSTVPGILGDNPIFGAGYRMATDKYGIIPDNVFLSSMLETGIIGFLLYLSLLTSLCYCLYKNNAESLPLLLAYIASGMFVDISTFWISIPALIFFITVNGQKRRSDAHERAISL